MIGHKVATNFLTNYNNDNYNNNSYTWTNDYVTICPRYVKQQQQHNLLIVIIPQLSLCHKDEHHVQWLIIDWVD